MKNDRSNQQCGGLPPDKQEQLRRAINEYAAATGLQKGWVTLKIHDRTIVDVLPTIGAESDPANGSS